MRGEDDLGDTPQNSVVFRWFEQSLQARAVALRRRRPDAL
jgi:hypothetical protein